MPDNRSAARVAVHCEAVKVSYRQTKDGMVVSFAIHPNDMPQELALAPVGTRVMLAIAAIGDDEQPQPVAVAKPRDPSKSERAKESYRSLDAMGQAVTRASMLCQDEAFQVWLARILHHGMNWSGIDRVAVTGANLRKKLHIDSRREIGTDEQVYERFRDLEYQFQHRDDPEPR